MAGLWAGGRRSICKLAGKAIAAAIAAAPLLWCASPAWAQIVIPGSVQPGRADQPVQRPAERPGGEAEVSRAEEEAAADLPASGITLDLKEIVVEGATVLTDADFRPIYAEYLGRPIPVEAVFEIAGKLTSLYRFRGYILSQVIVPPQEVDGGRVVLKAVEGFVDRVEVEGNVGHGRLVQATVEKISRARPLNTAELERYLLLAGDLAGMTVRGVFSPSKTTQGAATLTVVAEFDPFEGAVAVGNDGSDFVGPYLGSAEASFNSALGLNERIGVRVAGAADTEELRFGEVFMALPIGTEGTLLTGRASVSKAEPGEFLSTLGFESDAVRWSIGMSQNIRRSRRHNLFASVALDWDDLESRAATLGDISDDRLRVIRSSLSGDYIDSWLGPGRPGVTGATVTWNHGLSGLGASDGAPRLPSRNGADAAFDSVVIEASRLQKIHGGWTVFFALQAQLAHERLLASEQIGFGGRLFGRGYDPSTITGDRGILTKAELQYQQDLDQIPWIDRYQAYFFTDMGRVERVDAAAFGEKRGDSLASYGGGLRLDLHNGLSADLWLAWRGEDVSVADNLGDDWSGYFRIVKEF